MAKILLVDDDYQVLDMLEKAITRAGYQVDTAVNGNEAIKHLQHSTADLLITDILMPEKEGIETIVELKHDFPQMKVIAISGGGRNSATDYLNTAQAFGADRTFAKPFACKELLQSIGELLGE